MYYLINNTQVLAKTSGGKILSLNKLCFKAILSNFWRFSMAFYCYKNKDMKELLFLKKDGTDLIFPNQLKNPKSVKKCKTRSTFYDTYI